MTAIQKKMVLMGNFSVGKTSLIRRYVDNSFSDKYLTTIGVKISKKIIEDEERSLMLLIWDIEGALDTVKRVNKTYLKGASGAIIVVDIESADMIDNIKMHLNDLYSINSDIPFVVAINKIDMDESFRQDLDEIRSLYPQMVSSHYTSAKSGLNVEKLFEQIAASI